MFLKALTLKGFKSFAEKTDLHFEPGVTVVVGPNGSGKSNLVDAIAWVLGAQGARALRGAKMDDVIFAGTTKKAALGRAEVSLTIDNSDQSLPIEFTEVTITRTLFRSGESEYRLNDVPCRLLDIQELLSDSRIGRTQHVIIGQGQLDTVLNARPEDRRAIIEEAAGVLKYRKRREKAQRRLEATEGNLTRLSDLVREVRRQLTPLERQADAARRHDGVRDELMSIRLYLVGKEIYGLNATRDRVTQEREDNREKEKLIVADLAGLDTAVLEAEAALMKAGDSDLSSWLSRAEKLVARTHATLSMLAERRRSLIAQRDASADESVMESLLLERDTLVTSIEELTTSEQDTRELLDEAIRRRKEIAQELARHIETAPRDDIEREYEAITKEQKLHEESLATLRNSLDTAIARLDVIRQRLVVLTNDHDDAAAVVRADQTAANALLSERSIMEQNLAGVKDSCESARIRHEEAQNTAASARAKYEMLVEAFETSTHQAGIDHVRNTIGVLGTFLENISVDDEAIDAFSSVCEELNSAIVIDNSDHAKDAIAQLSSRDTNARIVVLDAYRQTNDASVPDGAEPLARFVRSSDPRIQAMLDQLLSHVVLVRGDWKTACDISLAHPDLIVTTPRGDKFGSRIPWSLGKTSAKAITAESVEAAGRHADNASRALESAADELAQLTREYEVSQDAHRAASVELNEITSRVRVAEQTAASARSAIDARQSEAELIEKEITDLRELISSEQELVENATQRAYDLRDARDNAQSHKQRFEERKSELDTSFEEVNESVRAQEIECERMKARRHDAQQRLEHVTMRLEKDPQEQAAAQARRENLFRQLENVDALSARTREIEEASLRARDLLSEEHQRQTAKAYESTSQLESLRSRRRAAELSLQTIREALQKAEITLAETKTRLETTIEALRATFDCEPQVALDAEAPEIADNATYSGRARELERDLKLMGPINPLAVQEYDELNERHTFLTEQLEDVKASRKELHKVIKTIDTEIVTVFEKAFEDVQKHFSDLFSTLFSGGAGRLTLTDPSDLLNTGIEMEARPSGKNVRRLSLLSGGERSLTALAFLFAVFRSRPSPFYVMDEVEAALDEPNLMRFLDLVAEFRGDAQLLIVSHQKKTMEAADELYGVTMAPGGSSRAIKQRIEKPAYKAEDETGETEIDLVALEEQDAHTEASINA